jgi:hypothetical protein
MQSITIQIADNGVIKFVEDDNVNAGGETYGSTIVYDFECDLNSQNKISFLHDIAEDCGLEFGSTSEKNQIKIIKDWGEHYKPTEDEVVERISKLNSEIHTLQSLLK